MSAPLPVAWVRVSAVTSVAMAAASAAGLLVDATYARESASWAAQARGRDWINLFLAAPAILIAGRAAVRGSARAFVVWMGALLYTVYSYVLYSFFVHFGPWFLVYVATLGTAVFALTAGAIHAHTLSIPVRPSPSWIRRTASAFMGITAAAFGGLWLGDIIAALAANAAPAALVELGFPVNPIHVLDLGLMIPAMIFSSALLWKQTRSSVVLAGALLVFSSLMGAALAAMTLVLRQTGEPAPLAMALAMGAMAVIAAGLAAFLADPHA